MHEPMVRYTKLLIRLWKAKEKDVGMRLSAEEVDILSRAMFDAIDLEMLEEQLKEFENYVI